MCVYNGWEWKMENTEEHAVRSESSMPILYSVQLLACYRVVCIGCITPYRESRRGRGY